MPLSNVLALSGDASSAEGARRAWSSAVTAAALGVIALCGAVSAGRALDARPRGEMLFCGAVALGALAMAGAAAFAWRRVRDLSAERDSLRGELAVSREAEHWARAVVDQALDAVLIASPEGRLMEVNGAACALLGRGAESLVGRRLWDLLPLDERVVALRRHENAVTHGGGGRRLLRPDGSMVMAEVSWTTLADGRVVYVARRKRAAAEEAVFRPAAAAASAGTAATV